MKKRILLTLFVLMPFVRLSAQISEIEQIYGPYSDEYTLYTTIVRNYNDKYNVLMKYGSYANVVYTDPITDRSSFMIQNTSTGDIVHIVDLPLGYQVNDIRFVTLRKMDGVTTEDYCCFCGTRTRFDGIVYPVTPEGETPYYIYTYSTHGFAGVFSMEEALNPSSTYTANVRDVEGTKELYRMACYPEQYGYYYHNYNSYIDHINMDIIGIDDTVNAPSCFCRAKLYPRYSGSSVLWDNNMRFNDNEILTDITKTDDYVVTTSHTTIGDSLWIRYSDQEVYHILGGWELNDNVNAIDFSLMTMETSCENYAEITDYYRVDPAKICHTIGNGTEIGFHMKSRIYGGLVNGQYDYNNGTLYFQRGAYMKSMPLVKELNYMPSNDATAVLYNDNTDFVSVLKWKKNSVFCNYPVKQFYNNELKLQSLTLQERNGYEHLFWSGNAVGTPHSPMYLMSQRGEQGGGYDKTCHSTIDESAQPVTIEHAIREKYLRIGLRFPYDVVTYPVTYINFVPYVVDKEFQCVK